MLPQGAGRNPFITPPKLPRILSSINPSSVNIGSSVTLAIKKAPGEKSPEAF
jgi:hypothetical protein